MVITSMGKFFWRNSLRLLLRAVDNQLMCMPKCLYQVHSIPNLPFSFKAQTKVYFLELYVASSVALMPQHLDVRPC
jgi:hypothetical protein